VTFQQKCVGAYCPGEDITHALSTTPPQLTLRLSPCLPHTSTLNTGKRRLRQQRSACLPVWLLRHTAMPRLARLTARSRPGSGGRLAVREAGLLSTVCVVPMHRAYVSDAQGVHIQTEWRRAQRSCQIQRNRSEGTSMEIACTAVRQSRHEPGNSIGRDEPAERKSDRDCTRAQQGHGMTQYHRDCVRGAAGRGRAGGHCNVTGERVFERVLA
jgi:hypothetical protein